MPLGSNNLLDLGRWPHNHPEQTFSRIHNNCRWNAIIRREMLPLNHQMSNSAPKYSYIWEKWGKQEPIIHHRELWLTFYPKTYKSECHEHPILVDWSCRISGHSPRIYLSPICLWWCWWTILYVDHLHLDPSHLGTWSWTPSFWTWLAPRMPTSRRSSRGASPFRWVTQSNLVCCSDSFHSISLGGAGDQDTSQRDVSCSRMTPPYSSWRRRTQEDQSPWTFSARDGFVLGWVIWLPPTTPTSFWRSFHPVFFYPWSKWTWTVHQVSVALSYPWQPRRFSGGALFPPLMDELWISIHINYADVATPDPDKCRSKKEKSKLDSTFTRFSLSSDMCL